MIDVSDLSSKVWGSMRQHLGVWVTVLTLASLVGFAYETNATDQEVKAAVDRAVLDMNKELKQQLDQVLRSLRALELRVSNGDTMIQVGAAMMELRWLRETRKQAPPSEHERLDKAIRSVEVRRDALMDQMWIEPVVPVTKGD